MCGKVYVLFYCFKVVKYEKPKERVYTIIEEMLPNGNFLEL